MRKIKGCVLLMMVIISSLYLSGMGEREFHWIYIPLDIVAIAFLVVVLIANVRRTSK